MDVSLMIFDEENAAIAESIAIVSKIEQVLRKFKAEYQGALKTFNVEKHDKDFDHTESEHLRLLAKYQKAIKDTTNLWDRAIANLESWKSCKKEKAEAFLAGVRWALEQSCIEDAQKEITLEEAKQLTI